jgi:hypothetical protein
MSLHTLKFEFYFKQSVDHLPQYLNTLVFGSLFNQKIKNLPLSLRHLKVGKYYNESLLDHICISSIVTIKVGEKIHHQAEC